MCGFAGVLRSDAPIHAPAQLIDCLDRALAHRGPDGHGHWLSPDARVLLVHRRLAILDPGPNAAQPMRTPDGRHQIAFNGEIYNYRELRRALEARGEVFTTGSDTEVLLRLLVVDGPQALARVRGMFALAWWNADARALVLARDRFGIKPLYAAVSPRATTFASEIQALVSSRLIERTIDPAGVMAYLAWGSVPPSLTWIAGVESLAPGTWLRAPIDGTVERHAFADVGEVYARAASTATETEFRTRVGAAVQDSVTAHLVADVPVGVFLSGGIDSSAILSAAVSAGASGLNTYTVRFNDRSSEHEYARSVASRFGATHHELTVDASTIATDLPCILRSLDQPTLDAVNSFYVSRAVAATGIKAVLSGAGGDEMFGGYPSFRRLPAAMRMKRRLTAIVPAIGPAAAAVLPERLTERWRHFASGNASTGSGAGLASAYRAQRGLFMPPEIERIAGPALRDGWDVTARRLASAESSTFDGSAATDEGEVARLETSIYLRSQLLRDLDAMSMAHGLEVRLPFVDHLLLEAVWPDLGAHKTSMRRKRILHETLARPLPSAAVDRPKQGFTLPFHQWIGGDLQPFVRSGMRQLVDSGWIASDVPDATWHAWQRGAAHWSRPWALGILGHFLDQR